MPAAGDAGAQQRQPDSLAPRRRAQQLRAVRCRHGGKQGPDPLPRREKGRPGHGFERSPFALEGREGRQSFTAELDVANHARPAAARRLFRQEITLKVYQAPWQKLDPRLIPA